MTINFDYTRADKILMSGDGLKAMREHGLQKVGKAIEFLNGVTSTTGIDVFLDPVANKISLKGELDIPGGGVLPSNILCLLDIYVAFSFSFFTAPGTNGFIGISEDLFAVNNGIAGIQQLNGANTLTLDGWTFYPSGRTST